MRNNRTSNQQLAFEPEAVLFEAAPELELGTVDNHPVIGRCQPQFLANSFSGQLFHES